MKRIFAILLALVLSFSAVCLAEADSDLAYVQANGKLIVGITDFAPMDYQDENGDWIGFDADMAKAFAESLGGTESLVTYPLVQTHSDVPQQLKDKLGIDGTLLRISVGLENSDDLIRDITQALEG